MDVEGVGYNPITGTFHNSKGKRVGSYTKKYGRLFYKGKEFSLHRLAFYLMEGEWPEEEVDHINGIPHDNRWENLRKCSREENQRNKAKRVTNKSGYKGVWSVSYKDTTYFIAKICVNKVPIYLGSFKTAEDAALKYDKAALHYHGEFANINFKGN